MSAALCAQTSLAPLLVHVQDGDGAAGARCRRGEQSAPSADDPKLDREASLMVAMVVGANGQLGSACAAELLAKGEQVRATVRHASRAEELEGQRS
jgi:hypothetical protein